jgi:hypothetical protein
LIIVFIGLLVALPAAAQTTISRGTNLSVDATRDGRLAIDLRGDIWIVPGGGGDARQLTQDLKSAQRPRWSPEGDRLVYQAIIDGRQGIWVYDFATASSSKINTDSNLDLHPAWHPDGSRVLYSSDVRATGFDLWEIDLETEVRWRLTNRPGDETEGAWSADGRDLVYVYHAGNNWSLILRRHGEAEEVLLRTEDKLAAPSFRPDGSLITYFRSRESDTSIEMIILSEPRLTRTYADKEQFVVSPISWLDRHRMYYSANGQIRQRLFNAWNSRPLNFRATIQPRVIPAERRKRPILEWHEEPNGQLIIRAARMFDGTSDDYQLDNARLPGVLTAGHGPDLLAMGVTTIVASHADADRLNKLWSGKPVPGPRLLEAERWGIGPTSRPELDVTAAVVTSRSTGLPSGTALPTQFRAMTIAGLTPAQTLRGMGVNAAAAMRADPYLGRIATGASADLVFVDGDPLADIGDALNVVAIVRNGRFYSVSGLFDRAKSAESVD